MKMFSAEGALLAELLGQQVIENPYVPAGAVYEVGIGGQRYMLVQSKWASILLPLMLADMRIALRGHLDAAVVAAERRLFGQEWTP